MLKFILGTAGTGKTTLLINNIKKSVQFGNKAIILVPEQSSFEIERLIYSSLGPKNALEVEVLSFTRMCNAIFRKFGGLAGVSISDAGKYMLMSVALNEVREELSIYRKSSSNSVFLKTMVSACAEFKTAGLSPEKLSKICELCEESPLKSKLRELSLIYQAYQGLIVRGYNDPDEDLIRAINLLNSNNFFNNYEVFIDGFTTFMAAEFEFLNLLISQAKETTFAMTCDGLHDQYKGNGIFSPAKSAANRLIRTANNSGISVDIPTVLDISHRYKSAELSHLSKYFMQPSLTIYEGDISESIVLFESNSIYGEIELVAAQISKLVRENNFRFNEIAIVARETENYERAISTMFSRYNIPYFMDQREDSENSPLISGILTAIDAVRSNYDAESVLSFAKSPLSGLETENIAQLENYCYSWSIRGALWTTNFVNNPRGLAEKLTDADIENLKIINEVRNSVITPLKNLKSAVKDCNGKQFAKGIYDFLIEINSAKNLSEYSLKIEQSKRESFLDQSSQLWDALMGILDVFGAILSSTILKTSRMCELFRLAIDTVEIAVIPQTLDQVLIGKADRIRPGQVKAVFVIGAVEGVFPPQISSGGLWTDSERKYMIELGAELSSSALNRAILEQFFAYFAITLPSERLYISYSKKNIMGAEQRQSVIINQINRLFPTITQKNFDAKDLLFGSKSAIAILSRNYRQDSELTSTLLEYFKEIDNNYLLNRMQLAANKSPHKLFDLNCAKQLFGNSLHLSPSRVERYYKCPFSYFAAEGLSLKKNRKVEFTPLESGSVIHNVLHVMVSRHGGKGLACITYDQLFLEVSEIINEYLGERIEDRNNLSIRFEYLFKRLTGMLTHVLIHIGEEFNQSEFEPVEFEMRIRNSETIKPLEFKTLDGSIVSVEGIVDRVDVMKKNGKKYLRVIDYKSGSKLFNLNDILYGLNMQMLLYLFTITRNGEDELLNTTPAGVLYMPVSEKYVTTSRETANSAESTERVKQLKMNGLLLEDEEVLRGMEPELAGVFIPVKLKKGVLDAKSTLVKIEEMGSLSKKISDMIIKMAEELRKGEVSALPINDSGFSTCEYCEFSSVCGFEIGDEIKEIAKIDRKEFFKLLEEEQDEKLD